jgi:chromosome segregation ATPase
LENEALNEKIEDLIREGAEANRELAAEKAVTASLRQAMDELRREGERLEADATQAKADFERIRGEYYRRVLADEDVGAGSDAAIAGPATKAGPRKAETPGERQARRDELAAQESDIKRRIAHTQAAVGLARSRITSLTRATVDVKAQLPPGVTRIDVPMVKGVFGSTQEKDAAIREAKAELAPLLIELRTLEAELAKVKAELVESRSEP